ncbi:MAG: SUMF1/EgtB/PvdO family nonheme iron enzyme [Deltaproteobacteria bacterium]|nr:SUMF1/EgtB/PvdO family nonheme iron enzyme [Deltaproteobacteria bacterium]
MVAVPAGRYTVGCGEGSRPCWDDEKPAHEVELARFGIMAREVAMEEYDECVAARRCPEPGKGPGCTWQRAGKDRHPINCVTWKAASSYCAWRLWRLPTEAEWEAAARGPEQRNYPWGSAPPSCELAVVAGDKSGGCDTGGVLAAGSRPADRSSVGALDMGGNVREWTATDYGAYPSGKAEPGRKGKVNRGASWEMRGSQIATSRTRGVDLPEESRPDLGFRCVVDL